MATGFMAGAIISKMVMDTTKWDGSIKGVKKDEKGLKGMAGRLSPNFAKIGAGMVIAGALVIGTLSKMTTSFIETGDWIDKMSKRTGIGAEALSELAHVASLGGASLDAVEKGVKKMAKSLSDANDGLVTYQRAFDKIGLSYEGLAKLNPEQQFLAISEAIAGLEDPTLRAAVSQDIFGRAGTQLLPMMSDGIEAFQELRQEAHDLGIVYDTELAAAAAKLKDDKERLNQSLKGLSNTLIVTLVPTINDFVISITGVVKKVGQWARENPALINTIMKVVGGLGLLLTTLGPVVIILPKIIGLVGILGKGFMFLAMNPIGLLITALAALTIGFLKVRDAEEAADRATALYNETSEKFEEKLKGIAKEAGLTSKEFEKLKKKYDGNILVMARAIKTGKESKELQEAMNKVGKERVEEIEKEKKANEVLLPTIKNLIPPIKELKEETKTYIDFIKDMGIKTIKEKGDRTQELEGFIEDLNEAYEAGEISIEDWRRSTESARKEMEDLGTEIVDTAIPAANDLIGVLIQAPGKLNKEGIVGFPGAIAVKAKEGARKIKTIWSEMTDGLKTKWGTMWGDFIEGGASLKSFEEAFKKFTENLLSQFADMIGQMIAKWTVEFIGSLVKSTTTEIAKVGSSVTVGLADAAKGATKSGSVLALAVGSAIGSFVGTVLASFIGPKGPSARSTELIKDYAWEAKEHLKNLVGNLDAVKWSLWNMEPFLKVVSGNTEEMKMSLWNVNDKLGLIRKALEAPPSTGSAQSAGGASAVGTTVNIARMDNSVNLNGLMITDRDYARNHMLPEILHALKQRTEKKRLQEILGIA